MGILVFRGKKVLSFFLKETISLLTTSIEELGNTIERSRMKSSLVVLVSWGHCPQGPILLTQGPGRSVSASHRPGWYESGQTKSQR